MHLCTVLCAENGFCSCLTDKIEEAQKELKDPKGSQKGKKYFNKTYKKKLVNAFCLNGMKFVFVEFFALLFTTW